MVPLTHPQGDETSPYFRLSSHVSLTHTPHLAGNYASKVVQALQSLTSEKELGPIIGKFANGLKDFIGYEDSGGGKIEENKGIGGKPTGKNGGDEKPWQNYEALKAKVNKGGKGYYYSYDPTDANWQKNVGSASGGNGAQNKAKEKCAKIFLSCLPIIFSGLSYMYWNCKQQKSNGGWDSMKLTDNSFALGDYLFFMGYHPLILSDQTGTQVANTALQQFQKDFYGATSHSNSTYLVFLNVVKTQIHKKLKEGSGAKLEEHPIASLYFAAQNYFTHKQFSSSSQSTGSRKSIREMLYFIAALPFSPVYEEFDKYITEYFKAVTGIQSSNDSELKFPVADSAKTKTSAGDTLSAEEFKTYLTATCNYSPVLLGYIQAIQSLSVVGNSADSGRIFMPTLRPTSVLWDVQTPILPAALIIIRTHLRQRLLSLRQLSEKLGCLTKRTPRSLGDMFGFTWHLKGQLAKTLNNITTAQWLTDLAGHTPFSNNLIKEHGDKLKALVGTNHQAHNSSAADLTALRSSGCNKQSENCGPYLSPLTLSHGATFGKPAPYASTYLSWMVYLTDELETGFQELLDEFKNIDCTKDGV
ncbi:variant erythrocyte surface antigen-1 family protein [Babesia caballi]|uniref:Variant erythrocyte surface antigen-1 family protein n=1 Tax=Babesia caballi TaxID=5871 RepID=A0AAV4LQE4_BABCB|nr:variant erythrocyte surface antigen-1 family protein [Babesia caballi]